MSCPKNRHYKRRDDGSGKESPRRRRRENSFARKFITFVRESTALVHRNKQSRSACQRRGAPASISALRRKGKRRLPRDATRRVRYALAIPKRNRLRDGHRLRVAPSARKGTARLPDPRWHGRRVLRLVAVGTATCRQQHRKLYERRVEVDGLQPPIRRRALARAKADNSVGNRQVSTRDLARRRQKSPQGKERASIFNSVKSGAGKNQQRQRVP